MRLSMLIVGLVLCAAVETGWAQQAPGLGSGSSSQNDIHLQSPGAASADEVIERLRAENALLTDHNAMLAKKVALLEKKVKLLEERLRVVEDTP